MGVGLVARDHKGKVQGSKCIVLSYVTDPVVAEAIAARYGVEFYQDLAFPMIVVEGVA